MHLKEMLFLKLPFLGSTSLQIRKKLQKLFNNKLTSCKSKIVLRNPLESKAFSPSRIRYLGCYFQDLFISISVVAEMLPIMVRPNAIFNSEFVNIQAFHMSLEKKIKIGNNKLAQIQEHLLCFNCSPSYKDFSVFTRESNDFKLKIVESLLIAREALS